MIVPRVAMGQRAMANAFMHGGDIIISCRALFYRYELVWHTAKEHCVSMKLNLAKSGLNECSIAGVIRRTTAITICTFFFCTKKC